MPLKDKQFDSIYPKEMQKLSKRNFTPINIAIKASELLVQKSKMKILDIGSGVGKFCFIASAYTNADYYGVEYRKDLVELSNNVKKQLQISNVNFINEDITKINFERFDAFYFFNSFQEQFDESARIDNSVDMHPANYFKYEDYLFNEFANLKEGTRIVTYHVRTKQIPKSYKLVSEHFEGLLKCWEKTSDPNAKLF